MKKCTIWIKHQLGVLCHQLNVTIMYMTAIMSAIRAIDVIHSRVMFNFSLIINLI